jgi:rhamnulokinase
MADASSVFLAVDLGASSGRVVAGLFDGKKVKLEDVHRFDNGGSWFGDGMFWDVMSLWKEVQNGLRAAAAKYGSRIASVGVDTWGVDYALLGPSDELLGNPRCYRDPRTAGMFAKTFSMVPKETVFSETGLQFMEINTLYQLVAEKHSSSRLFDIATSFLMMPDLFHFLLSGEKSNEYTNSTTTQLLNPRTKAWSKPLLEGLGLPAHIFGPITSPGTKLGKIRQRVADDTGLRDVDVVLPGTHDTASAVMAAPAASAPGAHPDWCYISSGTWSLMGLEMPAPVINDACAKYNFTNEGGVGGAVRLLKNIAGLWIVQECRRIWRQAGNEFGWQELVRRANESPGLISLIDPDSPRFSAPKDMPQAIRDYCKETGQPIPATEGAVIRCALESLALRYRMVLGWAEELTGCKVKTIHIVGGGTQNRLLNQMAADACGRRVVAGPVEATAIGNVMMQAVTAGQLDSISAAREVVRASFAVETYTPKHPYPWNDAYARFCKLLELKL